MNKRIKISILLLVAIIFITTNTTFAAPIKIIAAHVYAVNHPFSVSMEWVKRTLERRTNGEIQVEIYPAQQMGTVKEHVDGVISGDMDFSMLGPREVGRYVPEAGILNGPYIFRDFDHAIKVVEGEIGQEINKKMIETIGVRSIAVYEYGVRHLTTGNTIARKPEDLKGLKIRSMDDPGSMAVIRAMGGNPVPVDFAELYLALRQGIADGQENPISTILAMNFHEVQKYLMLTGHSYNIGLGLFNEAKFQILRPDLQETVLRTFREGAAINDILIELEEEEGFEKWKAAGNEIIEVDVETFMKPVVESTYYDLYKSEWKDLYERIAATK